MKPKYKSYLKARERLSKKGYFLDAPLSESDYNKLYGKAKLKGEKNIARTFAKNDITLDKDTVRHIVKLSKELARAAKKGTLDADQQQQYDTLKSIYGSNFPKTQKDVYKFNYYTLDTNNAKSQRQALFLKIWELLDDKNAAEEFFGY